MSYNHNTINIQNIISSKINNVDFAKESENFSKDNILALRGNFMLAQTAKSFQDSYKELLQ